MIDNLTKQLETSKNLESQLRDSQNIVTQEKAQNKKLRSENMILVQEKSRATKVFRKKTCIFFSIEFLKISKNLVSKKN